MNPKTLKLLSTWCKYNNKKLRNVKRIYLSTPIDKRAEALKAIKDDLTTTVNGRVADVLEDGIAKRNICLTCEYNGNYPICAPTNHKRLKDNHGYFIVLECRNHSKKEVEDVKSKKSDS